MATKLRLIQHSGLSRSHLIVSVIRRWSGAVVRFPGFYSRLCRWISGNFRPISSKLFTSNSNLYFFQFWWESIAVIGNSSQVNWVDVRNPTRAISMRCSDIPIECTYRCGFDQIRVLFVLFPI
jgi:hypothetical protein